MRSALAKTIAALTLTTGAVLPQASWATAISRSPRPTSGFVESVQPSAFDSSAFPLFTCTATAAETTGDVGAHSSAIPLTLAMADFTGDSHPDLVTVKMDRFDSLSAHYLIEIQLTEGGYQSLGLTGPPGGLFVTPKDVTGDGTLDLVVRVTGSRAPVAVFLNDGCGHFAAGQPDPSSHKLQDPRSDAEVASANRGRPAPAVASGSTPIECQLGSRRFVEERCSSLWARSNRASFQLFLEFCSNRAPPLLS